MSSFSSPSPLPIPADFRQKSSSALTSTSMDNSMHALVPCPSPPISPLPLPASWHLTRRNERTEWQAGDYFDDMCGIACAQEDKVQDPAPPYSCPTRPERRLPYMHRPLPSLMTKCVAHALRSDAPPSYTPSPFSYASQTTYSYLQGDSAITDDHEEYDLESMDIHIRETYFATSAERGRWLSSPIASHVRPQAVLPMRGHSSPVKSLVDTSPTRGRLRRHKTSCSLDEEAFDSMLRGHDDVPCSSPLPPSSPLTSPMSNLSFLSDTCESGSVVDPRSNSHRCHSLIGTPELSISSTACTSPVEPTRTPSPREPSATLPVHQPTDFPIHPAGSTVSRPTSPSSPKSIDLHTPSLDATDFELDDILSPLSQFELDLPEAEPPKLSLSDTVNKPQPGRHMTSCGVDAAQRQDELLPIQSSSNIQCFDVSLDTAGGSGSNRKKKSDAGAKRSSKRMVVRSGSPPADVKKRRGTESRLSSDLEPLNKRSKLSQCRDYFKNCEAKSLPMRGGNSKAKRSLRSPSCPTVEGGDSESARPRDRETSKPTGRARLQQPTITPSIVPVSTYAVDDEFRVSLTGMLIEALATSRATSMDASALYLVLTQAHPYLAAERSRERLLIDIVAVLEAGRAQCGMFEKVDGSGERTRHKALDSRWFYVPERDEDPERASLIGALMPRQKRNETKKYKQYYYRPLDKISKWDPEDAP